MEKKQLIYYFIEQYKKGNSLQNTAQYLINLNYPKNMVLEALNEAKYYLTNNQNEINSKINNINHNTAANKVILKFLLIFIPIFIIFLLILLFNNENYELEVEYDMYINEKIINDQNEVVYFNKITTNTNDEINFKIDYILRGSDPADIIKQWDESISISEFYDKESYLILPNNLKKGDYYIISTLSYLDEEKSSFDSFYLDNNNNNNNISQNNESNITKTNETTKDTINQTINETIDDCIGTDNNCGGDCNRLCLEGQSCLVDEDCKTHFCYQERCRIATCYDNIKNCHVDSSKNIICEEEIDCGGPCRECPELKKNESDDEWISDFEIKNLVKDLTEDKINEGLKLCNQTTTKRNKEECFFNLATGNVNDYNICFEIETRESKNRCLMYFVLYEKEYVVCDHIEDSFLKLSCNEVKKSDLDN